MPVLTLGMLGAVGSSALLGAVDVDPAVFARAEVAAGSAPSRPREDPEATLVGELRPGAALRLRTPRSELTLRFEPRFYYRTPTLGGISRPLVLLRAEAAHAHRFSPRVVWSTEAGASRGEVDYTTSTLAFATPTTADDLDLAVITLFTADARTGLTWRISPRYELALGAAVLHTDPYGEASREAFATTTSVGPDVVQRFELDERSFLTLPVRARYHFVGSLPPAEGEEPIDRPDWRTLSVQLGYQRALGLRSTFQALAGVSIAEPEDQSDESEPIEERDDARRVYPVGTLAIEHVLHSRREARVTNRFAFSMDASLDPTSGRIRPVAGFETALRTDLGPRWSLTLVAGAFTTTTRDPTAPREDPAMPREDPNIPLEQPESTLTASLTAAYAIMRGLDLELGARAATRASRLGADEFEWVDRQIWGFAGVSWAFGFVTDAAEPAAAAAGAPAAGAPAPRSAPAAPTQAGEPAPTTARPAAQAEPGPTPPSDPTAPTAPAAAPDPTLPTDPAAPPDAAAPGDPNVPMDPGAPAL